MRHLRNIVKSGALAGAAVLLLPAAAFAAPDTDPIQLETIGASSPTNPRSGTLPNGVGWTVNRGAWNASGQGYAFYPSQSPQVWTFDRPVSVTFGLAGINIAGECFVVPAGSVLESLNPDHTWDPAQRRLCASGGGVDTVSVFSHPGPIEELSLIASGSGSGGRGPAFIDVTYDTPTAVDDAASTLQDQSVTFNPADNDTAGAGSTLDPTSVRLLNGGTPVTSLTTADGTYTVDTATGDITFTPAPGFTGTAAPVSYRLLDDNGVADDATITIEVGPVVGISMINSSVAMGSIALVLVGGVFVAVRRRGVVNG